jgi:hypothetical protein
MRHEVQDNIIFVFENLNHRTTFDENNGIPRIKITDNEAFTYLEQTGYDLKQLKLTNPGIVIGNFKGLPITAKWIFEIIKEEECGQTKLIPKISGNLKRNSKKENKS